MLEVVLKKKAGFTVLELAVVGLIIGILAALAIPGFQKILRSSQNSVVANDLRVFEGAFQRFDLQNGRWPSEEVTGSGVPTDMKDSLAETSWARQTPIGGSYRWSEYGYHQGELLEAVIEISPVFGTEILASRTQIREIDDMVDDGVLSTGRFRLGYENSPLYILGNIEWIGGEE